MHRYLWSVFSLFFPVGLDGTCLSPPLVGEWASIIGTDREESAITGRALYRLCFLYQAMGLARSLQSMIGSQDSYNVTVEALIHLIHWINTVLPPNLLQKMPESDVAVARSVLNELSLLYHQLLDREPADEIEDAKEVEDTSHDVPFE
jgi:hypothetical protein